MSIEQQSVLDTLDPSSAVLLTEHERLSSLYQHNAEMGDKYVTAYLTIVTAVIVFFSWVWSIRKHTNNIDSRRSSPYGHGAGHWNDYECKTDGKTGAWD